MIDKKKLKQAKEWIDKLANGIHPITSEPVKEDDVVNDVHVSRCLFYVSELLSQMGSGKSSESNQKAFWMSATRASKINVSGPNGITQFTRTINESIPSDMKPLATATVIKWLRKEGYLYEMHIDEKHKTNLPTEKGEKMGITVTMQQNEDGLEYRRVMYDVDAQRFMLSHIESIAVTQ